MSEFIFNQSVQSEKFSETFNFFLCSILNGLSNCMYVAIILQCFDENLGVSTAM